MHPLGWVVLLLAFVEGGWLAFDGSRALIVGDYITPNSGTFAGQLGPWAGLVSAVGIEPRSTLMMAIHVVIGGTWLVAMVAFVLRYESAWWGMLGCAIAGLWYLPFGTLLSTVQIVMLVLRPLRKAG